MRPSDEQVRRSLAALREAEEASQRPFAHEPGSDGPADPGEPGVAGTPDRPDARPDARPDLHPDARIVPPAVLAMVLAAPRVRPDAVERGRSRLASGDPTDDDLAGKVIGRLVCDRLR